MFYLAQPFFKKKKEMKLEELCITIVVIFVMYLLVYFLLTQGNIK